MTYYYPLGVQKPQAGEVLSDKELFWTEAGPTPNLSGSPQNFSLFFFERRRTPNVAVESGISIFSLQLLLCLFLPERHPLSSVETLPLS